MTISKFNIRKKITLWLPTIICTCALYSTANAYQEIIGNESIILQGEALVEPLSVNSNADNIPSYNDDNNTDDVKDNGIKKFFRNKLANIGVFALVSAVAVLGLAIVGIKANKSYTKYKIRKEVQEAESYVKSMKFIT